MVQLGVSATTPCGWSGACAAIDQGALHKWARNSPTTGFGADVTIAGEVDISGSVPVLTRGRFADSSTPGLEPGQIAVKHLAKPPVYLPRPTHCGRGSG
jgi:hypothetical protein